jgi:hypothetical protein
MTFRVCVLAVLVAVSAACVKDVEKGVNTTTKEVNNAPVTKDVDKGLNKAQKDTVGGGRSMSDGGASVSDGG